MEEQIECKYSKHLVNTSDFTKYGLSGPYAICKECAKNKHKKYRTTNKKYKEYQKEYMREYMKKYYHNNTKKNIIDNKQLVSVCCN